MSFLDGFLGQLTGGSLDIPTLAQMVGLSPDDAERGVIALGQAHHQDGDAVQTVADNTGLPADKLSALVQNIGGEGILGHIGSFMGAGAGADEVTSPPGEVAPAAEETKNAQ